MVAHTLEEAGGCEFDCSSHRKDRNRESVLVGIVKLTETLPCNKDSISI